MSSKLARLIVKCKFFRWSWIKFEHANNKTLNTLLNLSQLIWAIISVLPFALPGHCEFIGFKPHYWHFCSEPKLLLTSVAQKSGYHLSYRLLSYTVTLHTGSPKIRPSCRHEQHAHYMQEISPVVSSTWMNKLVIAKAVQVIVILQCCMSSNCLVKDLFF